MKRAFLAVLALAASTVVLPATADVGPGGFMSSNVTWLGHIPIDSPGVSARVVNVGGQARLYVAGVKGLTIYDLTDPTLPVPMGTTPLPNWQNEDVEVSADGKTVLIANDVAGTSYLIDATNPNVPVVRGNIPGTEHTISCADPQCLWAYGSSGRSYDLSNRAAPRRSSFGWGQFLGVQRSSSVHDLFLDETGLMFVDTSPRMIIDPREDPEFPKLVTTGDVPADKRLAYQHNSIRPRASEWTPRGPSDTGTALRPGELLLVNGETNTTLTCGAGSGPFATWSIRDYDKGAQMKPLDVFRPVNGTWTDGNPRVNAGLGCSGHWFTERDGLVAAGWFEHGTRFLDVNPTTGKITEVGFFQPVVGSASGAYWVTDEIVYVVDYERGLDILRFDRSAPRPSLQQIEESWLAKAHAVSAVAEAERYACKLAMQ
jgi:hypothetical protein